MKLPICFSSSSIEEMFKRRILLKCDLTCKNKVRMAQTLEESFMIYLIGK